MPSQSVFLALISLTSNCFNGVAILIDFFQFSPLVQTGWSKNLSEVSSFLIPSWHDNGQNKTTKVERMCFTWAGYLSLNFGGTYYRFSECYPLILQARLFEKLKWRKNRIRHLSFFFNIRSNLIVFELWSKGEVDMESDPFSYFGEKHLFPWMENVICIS